MAAYKYPRYPYRRSPDQDAKSPARHAVAIMGAGPVGMAAALDLAKRGIRSVLFDEDDTVSVGSRAICWSKRALEILDRLGVAQPMMDKGIVWNEGVVFFGAGELYRFNLAPQGDQKHPAFINLQQYYAEEYLVEAVRREPLIDLRWRNKVVDIEPGKKGVTLKIETPDGAYKVAADWLVAADGARSLARKILDLEFKGQVFEDRFLIADVKMKAGFPKQRWFWFDPPFHPGQSALLHMQADDVWRIDFQLGWQADPEEEKRKDRVTPRLKRMLGSDTEFDYEWVSVYTFQCRRLDTFRHGRVLFAGDAAHQVSPFGARGANSGLQDIDNLGWKLALVIEGRAPDALLDSYDDERVYAADENILNSTRATDFITPKGAVSRGYRDAVLHLAHEWPFARALVNSGRLSVPAIYRRSGLNSEFGGFAEGEGVPPGAPAPNPPISGGHLLDRLGGGFVGLFFGEPDATTAKGLGKLATAAIPLATFSVVAEAPKKKERFDVLIDTAGEVARLFAAEPGTFILLRPDQHVAARWRVLDLDELRAALDRATGRAARAKSSVETSAMPAKLKSDLGMKDPDGFYEKLIEMTRGLDEEKARLANAKLILLLANQIGDAAILSEAVAAARAGVE